MISLLLFPKFPGGKDGIINPMVRNMSPGYNAAKYDLIWVSTSRIAGKYYKDDQYYSGVIFSINIMHIHVCTLIVHSDGYLHTFLYISTTTLSLRKSHINVF